MPFFLAFKYKRIFGPVVRKKWCKIYAHIHELLPGPPKTGRKYVKTARKVEIKSAHFFKSSQHFFQLPAPDKPEFAFVGRSNVGKSSLINRLTRQKSLAKTSSTPGKTQLFNHYIIDNTWYLVDLPGYGFARVSKKARVGFENMIRDYTTRRQSLVTVFVLVDSRLEPQKLDLEFMEYLGISQVPFTIVFTKTDKIGKSKLHGQLEAYKSKLLENWEELPPIFQTSSETGEGCAELLEYIQENIDLVAGMMPPLPNSDK